MFLLVSLEAKSQELEVIQELSFGTIVIFHNNSVGRITIDSVGNVSRSTNFSFIVPPQFGIVRLSGFIPGAQVSITANVLNGELNSTPFSTERFSFDQVNTVAFITINQDGTEEFRVGGEISTSGSGNKFFADAEFTASYSITVNY